MRSIEGRVCTSRKSIPDCAGEALEIDALQIFGAEFGVSDTLGFRTRCARVGRGTVLAGVAVGCCAINKVEANMSKSKELIVFIFLSLALH